jgi:hypothetical protein
MGWSKIGGPAHSVAIFANRLAALTPDRQAVFMRDPTSGAWKKIGGPADALIGGGWDLYAVSPGSGDLWRYDGKDWSKVGGPGAQFVGICNAVYALTPDRSKVFRFDRYTGAWTQIGGPAQTIIDGGSKVYASSPSNTAIWEYSRYLGTWTQIGGPGSMWVGVQGTVYGLAPDKGAVFRYDGSPGHWTKVGGPADSLIGGGSSLYATQPGVGNLWRYSGTGEHWDQVGTPGTGFVACGREIYGMTTDRSEVYHYTDDNAESQRLRGLLYAAYDSSEFGDRVTRGFLVKRQSGEVLAEHCADVCFQPLSTLKLLPYLRAMIEADTAGVSLTAISVSWVQPTTGTPAQISDTTCLAAGSPNTQAGSATLAEALPTMMWESHNRTLDALLNRYGPASITAQAQRLGLAQTEMYFGCPQTGGPSQPWADNISTLGDLGRIFEGAESLLYFRNASTRDAFRGNMIVLDAAPGSSHVSTITGRTSGPWSNEFLRPLVEREAGAAKQAIVSEFMKHVVVRGKGGSGGPNGIEIGNSDFLQVNLPFKSSGKVEIQSFLVGWYVCQKRTVSAPVQQAEDQALETFRSELHTVPIRLALDTW